MLLTRISTGEYPPDNKLPSEKELSEQFDVSRPIVREALERLRKEGLIYSRQGSGSFVRMRTEQRSLGFPPVETIADIQRCYEFRLTIEPEAAYYAALRRNEAAIRAIAQVVDLLSTATDQQRHREDADFAFHLAIADASNNHYYSSAMQALRSHIAVGMKLHGLALMGPGRGLEKVLGEHREIYEAIRDGDAEVARQRMRQHLEGSRNRLFEDRVLDLSL
ncbi:GntR family transcriptional regulator [Devosia geojensis]|uniref:Pyruvate dehydrogenase complex repressor n=1 Tax=Devosia geojensis TaxID=443610 RepID=A0A0F5FFD9_9HYPH|nr:GntR family transcriptional regulator [Devosia geojensis]